MTDRTRVMLRWAGLVGVVAIVVGALVYRQCGVDEHREATVRLGIRCLLRVDEVSRAELRSKLDATAQAAKTEPRWPKLCARAFHEVAQTKSKHVSAREVSDAAAARDAIETGDLDKIEAALAPYAK